MPRELTEEDVDKIAEYVIGVYESAERRALEFQLKFGISDEAREAMVRDFRSMCGGEQVYLASVAFLRRTREKKE
jgi:hypothetical protein